jgi:hypothetical protein
MRLTHQIEFERRQELETLPAWVIGPDWQQPLKAGACRAPASRLAALTGCRQVRQRVAKQLRQMGTPCSDLT